MLKIENTLFREKFSEINIRQRLYKKKSFITLIINTEFYPTLVGEQVVSGVIEIKVDIKGIKCLDDLANKSYKGDIGSVTISVNNDGVWEHQTINEFSFSIGKRNGRDLEIKLETANCILETTGVMVSLYTTSTTLKELKKKFDLEDFYDKPISKVLSNNEVLKYFVKE